MKLKTIALMLLAAAACSKEDAGDNASGADAVVTAETAAETSTSAADAAEAAAASETAAPVFEDYADDWIAFADATEGQPLEERKEAFRRDVEAKFPAFYTSRLEDDEDRANYDKKLTRAIEGWADTREAFIAKHEAFAATLGDNVDAFKESFPDFEQNVKIGVVHSLGEMDGGTRTLDGENWLLFGIDIMVRAHKDSKDERPFFAHELFHIYHHPRVGECEVMWCALWGEGLAVYVSKRLFPDAGDNELLLNLPPDMAEGVRADVPAVAANMLTHFASEDGDQYSALFQFADDGSGLPARRGYYLGYLVAAEIGADKSLAELANMDAATAEPLVRAALEKLAAE